MFKSSSKKTESKQPSNTTDSSKESGTTKKDEKSAKEPMSKITSISVQSKKIETSSKAKDESKSSTEDSSSTIPTVPSRDADRSKKTEQPTLRFFSSIRKVLASASHQQIIKKVFMNICMSSLYR